MKLTPTTRLTRIGIGLVLLPLAAAFTWMLLEISRVLVTDGELSHHWIWGLAGGFAAWLLIYNILPRPLWIYVFGHELTHALAVFLHAGKVHDFHVSEHGGHIVSDKNNWFIALAPYFIPLYSLCWLLLWWIVHFFYPLGPYEIWLYAGLGLTWGFHITFSVSMIWDGQSDLTSQGVFFSLVLIIILNLLLIEVGLVTVMSETNLARYGLVLWHHTCDCYVWTGTHLFAVVQAITEFIARAWKRGSLF